MAARTSHMRVAGRSFPALTIVIGFDVIVTTALLAGSVWWLTRRRCRRRLREEEYPDTPDPTTILRSGGYRRYRDDDNEDDFDEDETYYFEGGGGQKLTLQHPYVQRRISDRVSYHNLSEQDGVPEDEDDDDAELNGGDDSNNGPEENGLWWSNDANWHHFEGYDRDGNRTTAMEDEKVLVPPPCATPSPPPTSNPNTTVSPSPQPTPRLSATSTATSSTTSTVLTRPHRNAARQRYNTHILPPKVLLVRHGQSMGNVNESLYATISDNAMPLTALGWEQARAAGRHLKDTVLAAAENTGQQQQQQAQQQQKIHFIVSPYVRTWETLHGLLAAWVDPRQSASQAEWYAQLHAQGLSWHEDPRIREQDFGNFQNPHQIRAAKEDRHRFGAFYYRFPHGESASDVRMLVHYWGMGSSVVSTQATTTHSSFALFSILLHMQMYMYVYRSTTVSRPFSIHSGGPLTYIPPAITSW